MLLFRVFEWDGRSHGDADGGPLHVPRRRQGSGRHDAPDLYGAWYCTRDAVSAVAEALHWLRGHEVGDDDFVRAGRRRLALARLALEDTVTLIDLDDPRELVARGWRPSGVATRDRRTTQAGARALFGEGAAGFTWWSAIDAGWTNATLFEARVRRAIWLDAPPTSLSTSLGEVQAAADRLGLRLA